MANRITAWAIDCHDGRLLADFWTSVLGWVVTDIDEDGSVSIKPSSDAGWSIDFLVVPDGPKSTKNRLHLDLNPTDRDQDAELQRLLALGARPVDIGQGDVAWHVLADPEASDALCTTSQLSAVWQARGPMSLIAADVSTGFFTLAGTSAGRGDLATLQSQARLPRSGPQGGAVRPSD